MRRERKIIVAMLCCAAPIVVMANVLSENNTGSDPKEALALARLVSRSVQSADDARHAIDMAMDIKGVRDVAIIKTDGSVIDSSGARGFVASDTRTLEAISKNSEYTFEDGGSTIAAAPASWGAVMVKTAPLCARPLPLMLITSGIAASFVCGIFLNEVKSGRKYGPANEIKTEEHCPEFSISPDAVENISQDAIIILDSSRRIIAAGPRGRGLIGRDIDESPHLVDILGGEEAVALVELIRMARREGLAAARASWRGILHHISVCHTNDHTIIALSESSCSSNDF